MSLRFEWDKGKADSNVRRHGVCFDEASTVFTDPLAVIFDDEEHSRDELREIIIGHSVLERLLLVFFTERGDEIVRIISARKATKRERKDYEEGTRSWIETQQKRPTSRRIPVRLFQGEAEPVRIASGSISPRRSLGSRRVRGVHHAGRGEQCLARLDSGHAEDDARLAARPLASAPQRTAASLCLAVRPREDHHASNLLA